MPATLPPTYSQAPLLTAAAQERARRALRRRDLLVGQLVIITAAAAARVGTSEDDRLCFIVDSAGSRRKIETAIERKVAEVPTSDLAVAAQPGDRLPAPAVVAFLQGTVDGADVPQVGTRSASGDAGSLVPATFDPLHEGAPVGRGETWRGVDPQTPGDLSDTCEIRGADRSGTIGPGLTVEALIASGAVWPGEPGALRRGCKPAKVDGREALAVDFLGGATLWVWADLLAPSIPLGPSPDAPLEDARGVWAPLSLVESCRPDAVAPAPTSAVAQPTAPAPALADPAAARARRALSASHQTQAAGGAPALTEGTTAAMLSAHLQSCIAAPADSYAEGCIIRIPGSYRGAIAPVMEELKAGALGPCRNTTLASDLLAEAADAIPGLYEVVEVRTLRYAKGEATVLRIHSDDPDGDGDELHVLAGLVELKGGALAPAGAAASGGALATVSKGAKGLVAGAAGVAKSAARKTGRLAVAEGKRKALMTAQELGGDTVLDVHDAVKKGTTALLEAFGLEKFAPAVRLAQDFAATSGARMLGEALEDSSPKLAGALKVVGETIERKQAQRGAQAVREAVAPVVGALKESLGTGIGRALAPALQSIGALPPAADEPDADDAEPEEPAPVSKGKKAAKKTPTKRGRKPAPAPVDDADQAADDSDEQKD